MLLPIDTWSAACCWLSACTSSSMLCPPSVTHCSIQLIGMARAVLRPCSPRVISATNEPDSGGRERAMSATTSTTFLGL